jgi:hypothetical protein
MKHVRTAQLAFSILVVPAQVQAQTDADRIQELEARVAAQDALIRSLAKRLDDLVPHGTAPMASPSVTQVSAPAKLPVITTSDGVTIKPRGRLQAEALLVNSGGGATPTGTQLRRIQLGADGSLGGGFRYSAEVSFAGSKLGLEDVLVAYGFVA